MKFLVVLALLVASAAAFAPRETPVFLRDLDIKPEPYVEGRITNGQKAGANQFPYQAGLSLKSGLTSSWCGGSLISATWVLTAAHCTNGVSQVTVYLGSTTRTSGTSYTVTASGIHQHSGYKAATLSNDVSLINIPAVKLSASIATIKLPTSTTDQYVGTAAYASGWGKTSDSSSVASALNYAKLTVIANSVCSSTYGSLVVTAGVLCTSTTNAIGTCQGDSGGPLATATSTVLIGVTSFVSSAGCTSGAPAGFARVSNYLTWIKTTSGVS